MESTESIFEELVELFDAFKEAHEGTSKKSKLAARTTLGDIKKLVTPYRKASVAEGKR